MRNVKASVAMQTESVKPFMCDIVTTDMSGQCSVQLDMLTLYIVPDQMFHWIINGYYIKSDKYYTVGHAEIMMGWLDPTEGLWVYTLIQGEMM